MNKSMLNLKNKYIENLKRLDKADKYFKSLSDEEYMHIDDKKSFELLKELLEETNMIYYRLKLNGIDMPVELME